MADLTSVGVTSGIPSSGTGTVGTINYLTQVGAPISNGSTSAPVTVAITGNASAVTSSMNALVVSLSPNSSVRTFSLSSNPTVIPSSVATITLSSNPTVILSSNPTVILSSNPTITSISSGATTVVFGSNVAVVTGDSSVPTSSMSALLVAISPNGVNPNGQTTMANSAPVTLPSNQTFSAGAAFPVGGIVAAGSSTAGNPVTIGGIAAITNPTAVSSAQLTPVMVDKLGKQVTVGSIRNLKGNQVTAVSSTTETNVVTASSLGFLDIYGCILANTGATATSVTVKDSSGGTTQFVFQVPAGDTRGFMLPEGGAFKQTTSSAAWTVTLGSVTTVTATMLYVLNT